MPMVRKPGRTHRNETTLKPKSTRVLKMGETNRLFPTWEPNEFVVLENETAERAGGV